MKNFFILWLICLALLTPLAVPAQTVRAEDPTPTATPVPTNTPEPTATPTVVSIPTDPPYLRPLIVVANYSTNPGQIVPGEDFMLELKLDNTGQTTATNLKVTFASAEFFPRKTGGIQVYTEVHPDNKAIFKQPMTAAGNIPGGPTVLNIAISYTDQQGIAYSETFVLTLNVKRTYYGGPLPTATPTPTPTAQAITRPQLVISGYSADVSPLQPGTQFRLQVQVTNQGNATARRALMIAGGGTITGGGSDGTPSPGSISTSGGDFTNFSPLGVSNVQAIGDIAPATMQIAEQPLIVNVSANPGAFSFKILFYYSDEQGRTYTDEQVITLLVYALPVVELNFYRPPDPLYANQPGFLPVQVVNLGKRSAVLGNLRVTAQNAELTNNAVLVGTLESGGYFPLDATIFPYTAGPLEIVLSVDYSDDFSQQRVISKTLTLEVMEAYIPEPYPPDNGEIPAPIEETFWDKIIRFLKGLFGLDSSAPTQETYPESDLPVEEFPVPEGAPLKGP